MIEAARSRLYGFYSHDLDQVRLALAAEHESCGVVSSADIPKRRPGGGWLVPNHTLFSQAIERRFGHVITAPHLHPAAVPAISQAIGMAADVLTRFAHSELVMLGGELLPFSEWREGALTGPAGVRAMLVRDNPDHPLLAFTRIECVPVPPAGDRPFVGARTLGPTMVDQWIGPLNELWRALILKAARERRLLELDAPPIIAEHEAGCVQAALDRVWSATREPPPIPAARPAPALANDGRLVPPLANPPPRDTHGRVDRELLGLAFVTHDRLLVQRRDRVQVLDLDGNLIHDLPPSGCKLAGVLDDRIAVFFGYFSATHPYFETDAGFGPDHIVRDQRGHVAWRSPVCGELTALDAISGRYLERAPDGLPAWWLWNSEPEDLVLGDLSGRACESVELGGDRPVALTMSRDLRFAWAGEVGSGTQIIELGTGLPHATPCEPDELTQRLRQRADEDTGDSDGEEGDDGDDGDDGDEAAESATAIAFAHDRWWLLWPSGILSDHTGAGAVRIVPAPQAAAFDPSGARLACMLDGRLAVIDVSTLTSRLIGDERSA